MSKKPVSKQFSRVCTHRNYKVILLGDYGVGKTSLFKRIKTGRQPQQLENSDSSTNHQHGIDYCTKTFKLDNGKNVQVDFWDTGGSERFRGSLTQNYYKAASGILLVYDATEPASLTNLRTWIDDTLRYTNGVSFFLLGNKYDSSLEHQVDDELSGAFALHNNISLHFKMSTKCSDDRTFADILQRIAEQLYRDVERNLSSVDSESYCDVCQGTNSTMSLLSVTESTVSSNNSSCCRAS